MSAFAQSLSDTSRSLTIRKSAWYIPTIHIIYIVAITVIVTSAAMIAGRII